MKKRIIVGIVVTVIFAAISGVTLLVFANPGTASDPLVTLSYLNGAFKTQIMRDVDSIETDIMNDVNSIANDIRRSIPGGGNVNIPAADAFHVVTLRRNQTLVASVGTEIMLRIGTATAYGPNAPALVNYTNATTLASGAAVVTNNMYLVTIEGNGLRATADLVRVLVRGNYRIN